MRIFFNACVACGADSAAPSKDMNCGMEGGTPLPPWHAHYGSMRRTQRHATFTLCVLLAIAAANAQGAVFMRMGRGAQALEQLGGLLLQSTDVRINGQPGRLLIYGFEAAPASLAPDLRKALPLPELAAGASMATHVENGQATTLLLLPGAGSRSSVAMLIEQTAAAHRKSQAAPAEWPGNIAYPGATPFFSAETLQTHTTLAVATTADSPVVASTRMDAVLTGEGWARVPPRTMRPGLTLYMRNGRICLFSATATDDSGGKTRITVLQRIGATP